MKQTQYVGLVTLLLLATIAICDDTNKPILKMRTSVTDDPMEVHNYPNSPGSIKKERDPIETWQFWIGTAVSTASVFYDAHQTHEGLKGTSCIEGNRNLSPSGDVLKTNLPIIAGLVGFKYILARAHVPFWAYSTIDVAASVKHIHAGMQWNACR